jgi:hypothetical protein
MVTLPVRLEPESCKVCSAEAVPAIALKGIKDPTTLIRGIAVTVAFTETVLELTPAVETEILPDKEPEGAAAATRTEIDAETAPLDGVNAKLELKLEPLLETSNPDGAVIVTLPVRLEPLTVKVWTDEAAPSVVLKEASVPAVERDGGATTVPLTAIVLLLAPLLDNVMLPLGDPTLAAAERRAEIVVLANVPAPGVSVRLPA